MQPTVPMILTTKTKRKKRKGSRALKKSRKVLAALVDTQIQIDQQHGIHLIKPTTDTRKQFIYSASHPKGSPTQIPAVTQYYNDNNTLKPKQSHSDE